MQFDELIGGVEDRRLTAAVDSAGPVVQRIVAPALVERRLRKQTYLIKRRLFPAQAIVGVAVPGQRQRIAVAQTVGQTRQRRIGVVAVDGDDAIRQPFLGDASRLIVSVGDVVVVGRPDTRQPADRVVQVIGTGPVVVLGGVEQSAGRPGVALAVAEAGRLPRRRCEVAQIGEALHAMGGVVAGVGRQDQLAAAVPDFIAQRLTQRVAGSAVTAIDTAVAVPDRAAGQQMAVVPVQHRGLVAGVGVLGDVAKEVVLPGLDVAQRIGLDELATEVVVEGRDLFHQSRVGTAEVAGDRRNRRRPRPDADQTTEGIELVAGDRRTVGIGGDDRADTAHRTVQFVVERLADVALVVGDGNDIARRIVVVRGRAVQRIETGLEATVLGAVVILIGDAVAFGVGDDVRLAVELPGANYAMTCLVHGHHRTVHGVVFKAERVVVRVGNGDGIACGIVVPAADVARRIERHALAVGQVVLPVGRIGQRAVGNEFFVNAVAVDIKAEIAGAACGVIVYPSHTL
jgi:hypothetical protein